MKKKQDDKPQSKKETISSLKNESHKKDAVQKGYNEENPVQPHGAFKPAGRGKKE